MPKTKTQPKVKSAPSLRIAEKVISENSPVFVIAEIGINHNGDMALAKKLIDIAVEAGCDAVKFQKRDVPTLFSKEELEKARPIPAEILVNAIRRKVLPEESVKRLKKSNFEDSRTGDIKWLLEFSEEEFKEIDAYCKEKKILWTASCWDEKSVDFIMKFKPSFLKIASASLTDEALLRHTRKKAGDTPLILSTGGSDMPMIKKAVQILGTKNLALLHCTSVYSTRTEEKDHGLSILNLRGIKSLADAFGVPIGFSSHDTGIMPTYAAAAMGACIVEKHITTWKALYGSDQASSINGDELKTLVRLIRELQIAKGDGVIQFYPEEIPAMEKLRAYQKRKNA